MLSHLRPAIVSSVLFLGLLGLAYPLAVTGVAQAAFPAQANGSLVKDAKGTVVGSCLIAQAFTKPEYLHPRPSAAAPSNSSTLHHSHGVCTAKGSSGSSRQTATPQPV